MRDEFSVDCNTFRDSVFHFQADEISEKKRQRLQAHLDDCEDCARYLELEDSFLEGLKARLARVPAPSGLKSRIRAALEREAPAPRSRRWAWLHAPGTAAAAASLVLALLLGTAVLKGPAVEFSEMDRVHVVRSATVVDLQCDRGGRTLEQQRRCRHARHVNALKIADGTYWNFSLGQEKAREIALDPEWRGRRVEVEGDFYPDLSTIYLSRIREDSTVSI